MTHTNAALPKAYPDKSQAPELPARSPTPLDGGPDALGEHALRCGAARAEAENDQSRAELLGFCRSRRPAIEQQVKVLDGGKVK